MSDGNRYGAADSCRAHSPTAPDYVYVVESRELGEVSRSTSVRQRRSLTPSASNLAIPSRTPTAARSGASPGPPRSLPQPETELEQRPDPEPLKNDRVSRLGRAVSGDRQRSQRRLERIGDERRGTRHDPSSTTGTWAAAAPAMTPTSAAISSPPAAASTSMGSAASTRFSSRPSSTPATLRPSLVVSARSSARHVSRG